MGALPDEAPTGDGEQHAERTERDEPANGFLGGIHLRGPFGSRQLSGRSFACFCSGIDRNRESVEWLYNSQRILPDGHVIT